MRADLTIFIDEAPTIEPDEQGFFHVVDRSGDYVVERIMERSSLRLYVERGRRILAATEPGFAQSEGEEDEEG